MQRSRDLEHRAQLFEVRRSGAVAVADGRTSHQLLNLVAGAREVNLVAIGHAELDAFGAFESQRLLDALAVHPDAVAAAEVFEDKVTVSARDLRVISRNAAVPQNEIVVGRAAHPERKREHGHADAAAVGIDDDQGRFGQRSFRGAFGMRCHGRAAAAPARSSSCARRDWQCEQ